MIAQFLLSALLASVLAYAITQWRRSRLIATLAILTAITGLYLVWAPSRATEIAQWAGIGRGVDLILYLWVVISLIAVLNLHLRIRAQTELITTLARSIALDRATQSSESKKPESRLLQK